MFVFLVFALLIQNSVSEYCPNTPCSPKDEKCVEILLNSIIYDVIRGISSLNITSSDPKYVDVIEDTLATLEFQSSNNTFIGLSYISLTDILFGDDLKSISFVINSPFLNQTATLNLNGYLINIPVSGTREAISNFGQQTVTVYSTISTINGSDGNSYLQFGNFSISVSLQGEFLIDYIPQAIDNSKEDFNATKAFAAQNGQKIFFFVKKAVWNSLVAILLENLNIYFASVPKNKLIQCIA